MLEVKSLSVAYGSHPALNEVSIKVSPGEIVTILGANGAGKSTLLRAIAGICEGKAQGEIMLDGHSISSLTSDQIVEVGVALVPEGRGIFGDLTVRENLMLGAYSTRARSDEASNLERVLELFPKLNERMGQVARTMSGGEQQMVAIARAMMSAPQILMLDEPSLGLSPLLCHELFQNLAQVSSIGIGVLLVEQNAKQSLAISDRGYLLENTRITHEAPAAQLAGDPAVQKAYLGAGGSASVPKSKEPAVLAPMPKVATVSESATPRRKADEQIGVAIDDLVSAAARVSAEAPRHAPDPAVRKASERLAQSRIEVVLNDIEAAARTARARVGENRASEPSRSAPGPASDANKPPVIEVYRRPRVEVYRRRPTGAFERD